jgi:hypothetical protein
MSGMGGEALLRQGNLRVSHDSFVDFQLGVPKIKIVQKQWHSNFFATYWDEFLTRVLRNPISTLEERHAVDCCSYTKRPP